MRPAFSITIFLCFAVLPLKASEVCPLLKKNKAPTAYLINQEKNISTGPVDLGDIPLAPDVNDETFKIDTKYLVIASPKNIFVRNPWAGMGYGVGLVLVKPSLCANGLTYKVVLNWVRRKGGVRPYRFEAPFPEFSITDELGYDEDVSDLYKFSPFVRGRLVNPEKGS